MDGSYDATRPLQALPEKLTMRNWNNTNPVPEDLIGAYEIVHIMHFAFVLQGSEIPRILRNVTNMLSETSHPVLSSRLFRVAPTCGTASSGLQ